MCKPLRQCEPAVLLNRVTRDSGYTDMAFYLVDKKSYLLCSMPPNWSTDPPNYGELGLVQFEEAIAGETSYFTGQDTLHHRYTACYFISFVPLLEIPSTTVDKATKTQFTF